MHDSPIDFCRKLGFTRRPSKLDWFRDLLMALDDVAFCHRDLCETVLQAIGALPGGCQRESA